MKQQRKNETQDVYENTQGFLCCERFRNENVILRTWFQDDIKYYQEIIITIKNDEYHGVKVNLFFIEFE